MNSDSSRRHSEQMFGYGTQMRDVLDSWHVTRDHARLNSIHSFVPVIAPQQSPIDSGLRDANAMLPPARHSFIPTANQEAASFSQSESTSSSDGLTEPARNPEHRLLPSREVSDGTIDGAYVSFILYCNPALPADIDTSELRRQFRTPPKSDGKTFSIYTLFELIRRLEHKSLKTWAQLAIELGVEPPVLEKGQSAQKVQQYAVRLKRWMHAMHVDAFFEYLLNKNHVYWSQIPQGNAPSEFGRDGVPAEEDLALRALLPETRPKRGRKKAEDRDRDNDSDYGRSPAQRPRLHSPTSPDDFGIDRSAMGDAMASLNTHSQNPNSSNHLGSWNGADGGMTTYLDHPLINIEETSNPADWASYSAYPQSGITPRSANPFMPFEDEPPSATASAKSRSRRRHGPTVSSAWPSSGGSSGTKLRGRPPNNRSVSDGPFSTFPANPHAKAGPTINLRDTPVASPITANSSQTTDGDFKRPAPYQSRMSGKPRGLHLQVPERSGGAVRLATPPPPAALSNGLDLSNNLGSEEAKAEFSAPLNNRATQEFQSLTHSHTPLSNSSLATPPPSLDQPREDVVEQPGDRTNLDAIEVAFIHCVLFAQWYDIDGKAIPRCSLQEAARITKQLLLELRSEASSKEAFLINISALAGGRAITKNLTIRKLEVGSKQTVLRVTWTLKYGVLEGNVNVKLVLKDEEEPEVDIGGPIGRNPRGPLKDMAEGEVWKQRYLDLYAQVQERNNRVSTLRKNVLESLIATKDRGI